MGKFTSTIWKNFFFYLGTKKIRFNLKKRDLPKNGINILLANPKNSVEEKLIESALYHSGIPIQFSNKKVLGITRPGDLTISDLKTGNFLLHIRDYKHNESDHLQALEDIYNHAGKVNSPLTLTPIFLWWHPRRVLEYITIKVINLTQSISFVRILGESFRKKNLVIKILETLTLDEKLISEFNKEELTVYSQDWIDQFFARQSREKKLIFGERSKSPEFVLDWILKLPELKDLFKNLNSSQAKKIKKDMAKIVSEIDGRPQPFMIRIFVTILEKVLRILFSDFTISKDDLSKISELSKKNTLIFVPNHQSNFDFPTIFYLLYKNHLATPFIAAGINMNFWPLGPILRRCGAFFLRRKFSDDDLYLLIFKNYINFLVTHKFNIEFYFEGGRSRTGKLLPPRFGMLSWILESSLYKGKYPVVFLPLCIQYEQVMEGAQYVRELKGEKKEKESFFTFLKAARVLRRRFGKVSVSLGGEIHLDQHTENLLDRESLTKPKKREILQKLAFEIGHEINKVRGVNMVSLISLCLLDCPEGELSQDELAEYIKNELDYLEHIHAPFEKKLITHFELVLLDSIYELTKLKVIQRNSKNNKLFVPFEKRGIATYYKNTILHFFCVDEILELGKSGYQNALNLFNLLKYDFYFHKKVKKEITGELSQKVKERKLKGRSVFYILETYYHGLSILNKTESHNLPKEDKGFPSFFKKEFNKIESEDLITLPESLFMTAFEGLTEIGKGYRDKSYTHEQITSTLDTLQPIKDNYSFKRIDG
tara:strand:- start:6651 stop:8951 length:2301 start_codon:yes stop_codon:yes gene_type:complete